MKHELVVICDCWKIIHNNPISFYDVTIYYLKLINANPPYNTNPVVLCPTWTVKYLPKLAMGILNSNDTSDVVNRANNSPKSSQMKTTHSLNCDETVHAHWVVPAPALNCRQYRSSIAFSLSSDKKMSGNGQWCT